MMRRTSCRRRKRRRRRRVELRVLLAAVLPASSIYIYAHSLGSIELRSSKLSRGILSFYLC